MNVPRFAWWLILAVCLIVGQAIQGAAAPSHASPNALTPEEITEGWLLLFDGETLFGWQPSSEANWAVADGVLTASEGKPGLLLTTSQWFTLTIHADGPHVATQVNGYPVADWTAPRAPHANPRKGLRRAPGTIMLQGHDPTTDLSFRNLRIGEMGQNAE